MDKAEPTPDIKFTNPLGDESEDEVSPKSPAGADGLEQRDRSGSPPEGSEKVTLGNSSDLLQNMLSMDQTARSTDYEDERERRYMEAVDYMDEKGIIAPDSEFRHHWDLIQVPLLIYVGIAVPYRIGFSHDTAPGDFGFLVDVFVDLFFIADIYMNFRTAVWNRHGELTYERKGIARQYLKGWFIVDTLGCLPINYVLLIIDPMGSSDSSAGRGNKVFRVLRLFKLLKLLRLARLKRIIARYEEEFYALASGFALMKIVIAVLTIGHWLACLWFGVGEVADEHALSPTGQRRLTWTEAEFGEFVCKDGSTIATAMDYLPYDVDAADPCAADLPCSTECASYRRYCTAAGDCTDRLGSDDVGQRWARYLTALYWAFMTMTTVGYGDIPAATFYEKSTAVLGMLIGGFTFGLIVGALGEMARKSNPGDAFRTKKISQMSAYLSRREVTPDLVRRIRVYFQSHYETGSVFAQKEYEDYFMRLPAEHRNVLAAEVGYLTTETTPGYLGQVPSFSKLDTMSIVLICGKLKTRMYPKSYSEDGNLSRDTIVRKGEVAQDMILMLEGSMNITESTQEAFIQKFLRHDDTTAKEWDGTLAIGNYLDDYVSVLPPYQLHYRTTTGYAQTECSVGLLSAEDVAHLSANRPQLRKHLKAEAARANHMLTRRKVKELFAKIDSDGSGEVDLAEFGTVMHSMGKDYTDDELRTMFEEIDDDGGGSIDAEEFSEWYLEEEELARKRQKREVGVSPTDGPKLTYSPRAVTASKQADDIDEDSITVLSRGGEDVTMETLRGDFIELDRIASKLQKDFEKIMVTVEKKMAGK